MIKTNQTTDARQYARVARIFPKKDLNAPNARIRELVLSEDQK